MRTKPELSIVILNYNTKDLLKQCLASLEKVKKEVPFEVIVSDNNSTDGSGEMVTKFFPQVRLIKNKENLGFAAGNNVARKYCQGEFVLFLNSDTIVKPKALKKSVDFMKKEKDVGALTVKLVLPSGELDKDARRSFPTPWVAFTHLVLRLDRVFPKSPLFAKYWYTFLPEDEVHEVDVIQGAFFLTRKKILDDVGWFDEDYFLDGEDIDLSWKIKNKGWKIVYYPKAFIIHIKGASKGKSKYTNKKVSFREKLKFRLAGATSMEIFYRKRLWKRYPLILNLLVLAGIKTLKFARIIKVLLS